MNKELIEKLKKLKAAYDVSLKPVSDEEVLESEEYADLLNELPPEPKQPSETLGEPKAPEEKKISLYQPFRYTSDKHGLELLSWKEFFKRLDEEDHRNRHSYKFSRAEFIRRLCSLIITPLISAALFAFPYVFDWALGWKIGLNIAGGIVALIFLFMAFAIYCDGGLGQSHRKMSDYKSRMKGVRNAKKKYFTYYYPDWCGYPFRVSDMDLKVFKELFGDDPNASNAILETKRDGTVVDTGFEENGEVSIIYPDPKVKDHLTNSERDPDKNPGFAPGNLWDYVNAVKEHEKKLAKFRKNDENWRKYNEAHSKYERQRQEAFEEAREEIEAGRVQALTIVAGISDLAFPEKHYSDLGEIIDILETEKAEDLKGAFAYLDSRSLEMHRISEEASVRRAEAKAKGPQKYRVSVKTYEASFGKHCWEVVEVEARSEAEAINAAMNMVQGALEAHIR